MDPKALQRRRLYQRVSNKFNVSFMADDAFQKLLFVEPFPEPAICALVANGSTVRTSVAQEAKCESQL